MTSVKRATNTAATVFINARLIDPASGRDEPGGLLVRDDLIADLGGHLRRNAPEGAEVIDCLGHVLSPGLIDCQVFTGDPGQEHRETLKTASFAAAAGGVTTIVCMPDTEPVIDQVALVDYVQRRARERAIVNVHIMGAVTKGLKGEELAEIGLLQRAGAVAFTNGKSSIASTRVMRNALLYSKDFGALIAHHTEDPYLTPGAAMNSGEVATRLGLPGVHKMAEVIVVERDVRLVEITGGRYHAATLSCRESLDVIRSAKAKKLPVTCGVSINHLTKTTSAPTGPFSGCAPRSAPRKIVPQWCADWRPATSTSSSRATIHRMPTTSGARSRRQPTAPSASKHFCRRRCAWSTATRSA